MTTIRLPHKWRPRTYQLPAWRYLESGGRHAELIWARRHGKDEVALHRTACAAFERVANYWHMLPEAAQARKAIWDAVNPHTGMRRIDEAFPRELRSRTREQEMQIVFANGSTWQVVGSDNFNSLVGSAPAGIVYSEWAIANPAARAYLRPIIAENNGWQLFITTPRGKNHAYTTFKSAQKDPSAFTQILTAAASGIFTAEELYREKQMYIDDFGPEVGAAMFEQEYMCSFDAAVMGAYYAREFARIDAEGRICQVDRDESVPVDVVFDIGWSDDTAIWFFQVISGEVHVIDYYASNGYGPEHYAEVMDKKGYNYRKDAMGRALIWLPHDGWAKTFAANGRSAVEQFLQFGYYSQKVPELSLQDGINATRRMLDVAYFDAENCEEGIEALKLYHHEYDQDRKIFKDKPLHDWTSHASDSARYMAIVWRDMVPESKKQTVFPVKDGKMNVTMDDLWNSRPTRKRM